MQVHDLVRLLLSMVVSSVFANGGNWTCNWDGWAIDRYELTISIDLHNE